MLLLNWQILLLALFGLLSTTVAMPPEQVAVGVTSLGMIAVAGLSWYRMFGRDNKWKTPEIVDTPVITVNRTTTQTRWYPGPTEWRTITSTKLPKTTDIPAPSVGDKLVYSFYKVDPEAADVSSSNTKFIQITAFGNGTVVEFKEFSGRYVEGKDLHDAESTTAAPSSIKFFGFLGMVFAPWIQIVSERWEHVKRILFIVSICAGGWKSTRRLRRKLVTTFTPLAVHLILDNFGTIRNLPWLLNLEQSASTVQKTVVLTQAAYDELFEKASRSDNVVENIESANVATPEDDALPPLPDSPTEPDSSQGPEPAAEARSTADIEPAMDAEPETEAQPDAELDSVDAQPAAEAESVIEAEPAAEAESVIEAEPAAEAESNADPDSPDADADADAGSDSGSDSDSDPDPDSGRASTQPNGLFTKTTPPPLRIPRYAVKGRLAAQLKARQHAAEKENKKKERVFYTHSSEDDEPSAVSLIRANRSLEAELARTKAALLEEKKKVADQKAEREREQKLLADVKAQIQDARKVAKAEEKRAEEAKTKLQNSAATSKPLSAPSTDITPRAQDQPQAPGNTEWNLPGLGMLGEESQQPSPQQARPVRQLSILSTVKPKVTVKSGALKPAENKPDGNLVVVATPANVAVKSMDEPENEKDDWKPVVRSTPVTAPPGPEPADVKMWTFGAAAQSSSVGVPIFDPTIRMAQQSQTPRVRRPMPLSQTPRFNSNTVVPILAIPVPQQSLIPQGQSFLDAVKAAEATMPMAQQSEIPEVRSSLPSVKTAEPAIPMVQQSPNPQVQSSVTSEQTAGTDEAGPSCLVDYDTLTAYVNPERERLANSDFNEPVEAQQPVVIDLTTPPRPYVSEENDEVFEDTNIFPVPKHIRPIDDENRKKQSELKRKGKDTSPYEPPSQKLPPFRHPDAIPEGADPDSYHAFSAMMKNKNTRSTSANTDKNVKEVAADFGENVDEQYAIEESIREQNAMSSATEKQTEVLPELTKEEKEEDGLARMLNRADQEQKKAREAAVEEVEKAALDVDAATQEDAAAPIISQPFAQMPRSARNREINDDILGLEDRDSSEQKSDESESESEVTDAQDVDMPEADQQSQQRDSGYPEVITPFAAPSNTDVMPQTTSNTNVMPQTLLQPPEPTEEDETQKLAHEIREVRTSQTSGSRFNPYGRPVGGGRGPRKTMASTSTRKSDGTVVKQVEKQPESVLAQGAQAQALPSSSPAITFSWCTPIVEQPVVEKTVEYEEPVRDMIATQFNKRFQSRFGIMVDDKDMRALLDHIGWENVTLDNWIELARESLQYYVVEDAAGIEAILARINEAAVAGEPFNAPAQASSDADDSEEPSQDGAPTSDVDDNNDDDEDKGPPPSSGAVASGPVVDEAASAIDYSNCQFTLEVPPTAAPVYQQPATPIFNWTAQTTTSVITALRPAIRRREDPDVVPSRFAGGRGVRIALFNDTPVAEVRRFDSGQPPSHVGLGRATPMEVDAFGVQATGAAAPTPDQFPQQPAVEPEVPLQPEAMDGVEKVEPCADEMEGIASDAIDLTPSQGGDEEMADTPAQTPYVPPYNVTPPVAVQSPAVPTNNDLRTASVTPSPERPIHLVGESFATLQEWMSALDARGEDISAPFAAEYDPANPSAGLDELQGPGPASQDAQGGGEEEPLELVQGLQEAIQEDIPVPPTPSMEEFRAAYNEQHEAPKRGRDTQRLFFDDRNEDEKTWDLRSPFNRVHQYQGTERRIAPLRRRVAAASTNPFTNLPQAASSPGYDNSLRDRIADDSFEKWLETDDAEEATQNAIHSAQLKHSEPKQDNGDNSSEISSLNDEEKEQKSEGVEVPADSDDDQDLASKGSEEDVESRKNEGNQEDMEQEYGNEESEESKTANTTVAGHSWSLGVITRIGLVDQDDTVNDRTSAESKEDNNDQSKSDEDEEEGNWEEEPEPFERESIQDELSGEEPGIGRIRHALERMERFVPLPSQIDRPRFVYVNRRRSFMHEDVSTNQAWCVSSEGRAWLEDHWEEMDDFLRWNLIHSCHHFADQHLPENQDTQIAEKGEEPEEESEEGQEQDEDDERREYEERDEGEYGSGSGSGSGSEDDGERIVYSDDENY